MIIWLIRWICGFVGFVGNSGDKGLFLDSCRRKGIALFSVKSADGVLYAFVSVKDYRRIRSCAHEAGMQVRLRSKKGAPFCIRRFRRRPGIVVGLILTALMMQILSLYVWDVRVEAEGDIRDSLIAELAQQGIVPGTKKSDLFPRRTEQLLILSDERLSWAGLTTMGSRVILRIRLREDAPPFSGTTGQAHIVAQRDGIIASVSASSGEALVKVGEAVRKGEVLISGIITEEKTGSTLYRKAVGSVQAYTVRNITVSGLFEEEITTETAEKQTVLSLQMLGAEIPLYLFLPDSPWILYEETDEILSLFGHETGITVRKQIFCRTQTVRVTRTEEQLLEILRLQAYDAVLKQLPAGTVLSSKESVEALDGGISLSVQYYCLEEIGTSRPL